MVTVLKEQHTPYTFFKKEIQYRARHTVGVPGGSRDHCPGPRVAPFSGCHPLLPLSWQEARHPPAQVLLQHLVNADPERLIVEAFPDVVLVDPEFRGSHCFPFWDLGKIKSELPMVVAWVEKLFVVFHWKGKNTHRHQKLISNWVSLSSLRVEASGLS